MFLCIYVWICRRNADRGPQRQAGNQAARQEKTGPEFQAMDSYGWKHWNPRTLYMSMSQNPGTLGTLKKKMVYWIGISMVEILWYFQKQLRHIEPCKQFWWTWNSLAPREYGFENKRMVLQCQWKVQAPSNPIASGWLLFEGRLEVKLPTIRTNEKQSREEAERRERLEERRVEEKE